MDNTEPDSLLQVITVKKREAILALAAFNTSTGEHINNYQKVCDDLIFNIKKRLHFTTHRYHIVSNFFKDFSIAASVDLKFSQKLKDLEEKERKADVVTKDNEVGIDGGIAIFYNDMKNFVEGANKLNKSLETEILGKVLKDTLKKSEQEIKEYQDKIKKNSQTLEKKGKSVVKRLTDFNKTYGASIRENEAGRRTTSDTTEGLINYVNRVQDLVNSIEMYGKQVLKFRDMATDLNFKYNISLKSAVSEFIKYVAEFVGDVSCYKFSESMKYFKMINLEETKGNYFELTKLCSNATELGLLLDGVDANDETISAALRTANIQTLAPLFSLFSYCYYHYSDAHKNPTDSMLIISHDYFVSFYKRNKQSQFEKTLYLPLESLKMDLDDTNKEVKCIYKTKRFVLRYDKTIKVCMEQDQMLDLINKHNNGLAVIKEMSMFLVPKSSSNIDRNNSNVQYDENKSETSMRMDRSESKPLQVSTPIIDPHVDAKDNMINYNEDSKSDIEDMESESDSSKSDSKDELKLENDQLLKQSNHSELFKHNEVKEADKFEEEELSKKSYLSELAIPNEEKEEELENEVPVKQSDHSELFIQCKEKKEEHDKQELSDKSDLGVVVIHNEEKQEEKHENVGSMEQSDHSELFIPIDEKEEEHENEVPQQVLNIKLLAEEDNAININEEANPVDLFNNYEIIQKKIAHIEEELDLPVNIENDKILEEENLGNLDENLGGQEDQDTQIELKEEKIDAFIENINKADNTTIDVSENGDKVIEPELLVQNHEVTHANSDVIPENIIENIKDNTANKVSFHLETNDASNTE